VANLALPTLWLPLPWFRVFWNWLAENVQLGCQASASFSSWFPYWTYVLSVAVL
jgi:hypothetical protein